MQKKPVIIIAAYNRPDALKRLLKSVANADYGTYDDIPLIISIDGGGPASVVDIANNFDWQYGKKDIIIHDSNLGLKEHILSCGDLTERYGSVIILEDDLIVSPAFYDYASKAGDFCQDDDRIAGIGLYSPNYCEYTQSYFFPIDDAYDNYFLRSTISSGQMWTRKQWESFRDWLIDNPEIDDQDSVGIPEQVLSWPESSWKKHFIRYQVFNNKYFVCPRVSLTSNMGDAGEHFKIKEKNIQVPLQTIKKDHQFSKVEDSFAIYNQYYEIDQAALKKHIPELNEYEFECDLAGIKDIKNIASEYLLSIKDCSVPIYSFGMELVPIEANVIHDIEGNEISFGKTSDFNSKVNPKKKLKEYLLLHKVFSVRFFREILTPLVKEGIKSKLKK